MMTEETLKDNIKLVRQLNSLSVLQFSDKVKVNVLVITKTFKVFKGLFLLTRNDNN
jgi:hypothetical protein